MGGGERSQEWGCEGSSLALAGFGYGAGDLGILAGIS